MKTLKKFKVFVYDDFTQKYIPWGSVMGYDEADAQHQVARHIVNEFGHFDYNVKEII